MLRDRHEVLIGKQECVCELALLLLLLFLQLLQRYGGLALLADSAGLR